MKFDKKLSLPEAVETLGQFEAEDKGTANVVYHDAITNMKKARELADERLKEQNKITSKPVDGTAKGGQTTIKNIPEAKKLHLSEAYFDSVAYDDAGYEEWYDMYSLIMDSFTETGLDFKKHKIPKAVPAQFSVACTAPDHRPGAENHFPIGVDLDDNVVVHCSNENTLNAYIECAEAYKLSYKVIDNKKPGEYDNFTIKVAIPKDSFGQVECIGDYCARKNIPLDTVLGFTDATHKTTFAMSLAKEGELFANPDDNKEFVKSHRAKNSKQVPVIDLTQDKEAAATVAPEEPMDEAVQGKRALSAKLKSKLGVKESVSARPNSDRLIDMIDGGVIDVSALAKELIEWLSDDDVREFARIHEYFPVDTVEEVLTEGKEVTFTLDGKEYKGTCVGHSSTNPDMCDVRIGKEYYDNEENINLRKGIYNPHEGREIKDGKFFIPKSDLKECGLTEAYVKDTLKNFIPFDRTGAVETWQIIKDNDKFAQFELMIEEMYPEGIDSTTLNDLLWFERDWVLDMLHISNEG